MKQLLFAVLLLTGSLHAQDKYFTKTGRISFDATSPKSPENIVGVNKAVTCVIDTKSGQLQFSLLMKGFEFERALMQEHFNENYVESNLYPKAEFKGAVADPSLINFQKDGVYPVTVKGKLTMHGKSRELTTSGKLTVQHGKILLNAVFSEQLSDYGVTVPQIVSDKVSQTVKISVDCTLELLK
jgi:polyisoprenoid-binding protein YceI